MVDERGGRRAQQCRSGAADVAHAAESESEADVGAEVGDVDPVRAAADSLATFPADELVVLVRSDDRASWLERSAAESGFERLGLPVRYVVVGGEGPDRR